MSGQRKSAKLQLRRSISEQLRDSTAKAWDLLWRNVRERRLAEIEAKEACDWLRAAGFPQYAQLYEDAQFPIDISSVKRDHDFLDRDLVEPLCRRLNTLNKCASMKLDVSHQRKKGEDSDEDDPLAISKRWTFEWSSRRWSRLQDFLLDSTNDSSPTGGQGAGLHTTVSSESVLTDLSEQEITEISSIHSEDSTLALPDSVSMASLSASYQPPRELTHYNTLPVKRHGGKSKAKEFLKKMELMRTWGPSTRRKSANRRPVLVISGPVLQGEEPRALRVLQCTPISQLESSNKLSYQENDDSNKLSYQENGENSGSVSPVSNHKDSPVADSLDVETSAVNEMRPKQRTANKRSSKYLEDMELPSQGKRTDIVQAQFGKNQFHSYENLLIHIPKDHKPGTFPKALSIESLAPASGEASPRMEAPKNGIGREHWSGKALSKTCPGAPRGSRVSVYDNVPGSHLYASTGDLLDLEKEENLFPHLDDIIQHVSGLQQIVDHWSRSVLPEGEMGEEEDRTTPSEGDRDAVSLNDTDSTGTRERRDSGVGASLTRPRLRWPSFRSSDHQPSSSLLISSQSAGQLSLLQKFSLLRLTAIMEKYSMSNKHGWTWSVPKFMKRMKVPDYKEKSVFGVPLIVHVQRCGFPLPLCLQQALSHLKTHCLDQVGLFRKSGVKSRIQALRQQCELSPDFVSYEDQSAYDVADMVKQFFRDLPEPLLTSKLGETFLHIYQYVPKEQRLQAVRAAILLMPDENREVLQTLLFFLRDVTSLVEENQMTPMNLAVCLGPSLFHLSLLKNETLSPRSIQRKYTTGRPDQKDLNENLAATQGLSHMIAECHRLFQITEEMVTQSRNSYMEAELLAPPLDELGKVHDEEEDEEDEEEDEEGSYHTHIENLIQSLLKEAKDKSKSWMSRPIIDHTELAFKKVGDGNPLRLWRIGVEVAAAPCEVLQRLLKERPLWQSDLLQEKVLETLDRQTDVYQFSCRNMAPQSCSDYVVLRSWRTDLGRGACALVTASVDHEDSAGTGSVRGVVLESHFLLEPSGTDRTRLTHLCRVDLRGRSPEWYNKAFGHLLVNEAHRIRSSFQNSDLNQNLLSPPQTCSLLHRPALFSTDLLSPPQTCSLLHRPSLSSTDLLSPPQTCSLLHRPSLSSTDLLSPPQTCSLLHRPALFSTDLLSPPQTCSLLHRPSLSSTDLLSPPQTFSLLHRPSLSSTDLLSSPQTCSLLHRPALSSTDLLSPPQTCSLLHRPALSSTDLLSPPQTFSLLHRPALSSTDLLSPPQTFSLLHRPALSSTDLLSPPQTFSLLHRPALSSTDLLSSPQT
uniref:StAR-related lipid transfer protein 13 n=1 Tax=Knipowitschia caucasica TaxID=637954 RepID=A0AAV2J6N0_KNICA